MKQQLEAYQALRAELTELTEQILPKLSKKILKQVSRKLHLNRLHLHDDEVEDVNLVAVDYALYHARPDGQTLFEAHFEAHPPTPGSPQEHLRDGLRRYRYTFLEIDAVQKGVGVEVHDLIYDEPFLLKDLNLSKSGKEGMFVASGLLFLGDYAMSTGAMLPLSQSAVEYLVEEIDAQFGPLEDLQLGDFSARQANNLAALIIREALREGAFARIG